MYSAPVTAIKVLNDHRVCLAGTGPYVLAFDLTSNQQLLRCKVLLNAVVHGFDAHRLASENDSSYIVVVFGQRTFAIVQWSSACASILTTIVQQTHCPSWLLSSLIVHVDSTIEQQSLTVLFGSASNQVYRYSRKSSHNDSLELVQSFQYTTLYSSCLFRHSNEQRVILASGTLFGQLIIYEQEQNSNEFQEKTLVSDHNGAIFGITYYKNLLCTVGDDRTVKLYHLDDCSSSLRQLASFFAHEARIWRASLTSTHIVTCGEDCSVRVWSHRHDGQLLRHFTVQRCKNAWCVDLVPDNETNIPSVIVSGWSDGCVRRHHLDDVLLDSHRAITLENDVTRDHPRNVVFLDSKNILIQMNSGRLLRVLNDEEKQDVSLFYDGVHTLTGGYAKMTTSNGRLAVGSLTGRVLVFDQNGTKLNEFQVEIANGKTSKILQILWLDKTSSHLLVCVSDGLMFVYNIASVPATLRYRLQPLPEFEQRWPNACLFLAESNLLLIGDRQGNLLSYDLDHLHAEHLRPICQLFEHLHGLNGTSALTIDDNTGHIRSCGRDGYLNSFSLNDQRQLVLQTTCTIAPDIVWLDRLVFNPSLITCFTTNNFCLYTLDEQPKRRLMEVECGGGHRNCDFLVETDANRILAQFVYVRNKQIFLATKNLTRILNEATCLSTIPATHGTEIRCVKWSKLENQRLCMITGSEDTQIKIFSENEDKSKWEHVTTLQAHLSAVCDLISIDNLFFSCGARAQLFAWQMTNQIVVRAGHFMLHPLRRRHGGGGVTDDTAHDDDHGLDVRFTSVAVLPLAETGNYLLFVAASDAQLRVFRYTASSQRFQLLHTCSHSDYCQLRVKVYVPRNLVFVSSTDGTVCAYEFTASSPVPVRSSIIKLHQSGINDFDFIEMIDNDRVLLRLATVGDDGSVQVSILNTSDLTWTEESSAKCTHQSPATGVHFLNTTILLSIGIDQRLKLWTIENDDRSLNLEKIHLVDIRDILGMDVICRDGEFLIVIVGAGVQTIRFDLATCSFHF